MIEEWSIHSWASTGGINRKPPRWWRTTPTPHSMRNCTSASQYWFPNSLSMISSTKRQWICSLMLPYERRYAIDPTLTYNCGWMELKSSLMSPWGSVECSWVRYRMQLSSLSRLLPMITRREPSRRGCRASRRNSLLAYSTSLQSLCTSRLALFLIYPRP